MYSNSSSTGSRWPGNADGQRCQHARVDERALRCQIQYRISAGRSDLDIGDLPVSLDDVFHDHDARGLLVLIPVLDDAVAHVDDVFRTAEPGHAEPDAAVAAAAAGRQTEALSLWRRSRPLPCRAAFRSRVPTAVPFGSLDDTVGFGGVRGFCFGSGSAIFGGVCRQRAAASFFAICGSVDGSAA